MLRSVSVLRLVLVTLLLALPFAALTHDVFSDVPDNAWYADYVHRAAALGIVNGYSDADGHPTGKFGPADPVTLPQALKIAVEGANYDLSAYALEPTVAAGHWADPYLKVARTEGFWVFQQPELYIDRPATRAEVAQIFADAFLVETEGAQAGQFTDVTASTPYALAIEALSEATVVSGDTDAQGNPLHRFRPTDRINRAEVVKIVMRARDVFGHPFSEPAISSSRMSSSLSSSSSLPASSSSASVPASITVQYASTGFSPAAIIIPPGMTVTFVNQSGADMWVASNPHPVHTDYAGFDAGRPQPVGQSYSFTFTRIGEWFYHDHLNPGHSGRVTVQ